MVITVIQLRKQMKWLWAEQYKKKLSALLQLTWACHMEPLTLLVAVPQCRVKNTP